MSQIQDMVDFVVAWCNDDSHGYSQYRRWGPDCDCSSLMYMAADHAGYGVGTGEGSTSSMIGSFSDAGFSVLKFDGNLDDLEAGDILLTPGEHTEMYIGDGQMGGAHIDENGGIAGPNQGDQTGHEVSIVDAYIRDGGWDYVLCPPRDSGDSSDDSGSDSGTHSGCTVNVVYNASTAEEGELGSVQNGQELGVEGHWQNGFAAMVDKGSIWYECHVLDGDWTERKADGEWVKAPDGKFFDGVRIYYTTPDGEVLCEAAYQVHASPDSPGPNKDVWFSERTDDDADSDWDTFGGSFGDPYDMLKVDIQLV